ncbi:hypothetical protein DSM106972_015970 [Dulcicalothrix desertica PCC 7102]|uniref:Uncharacterized protein n=1 Tax=Dulcicalothrix desertica PCC 7102 TaxID=232991 RepID=A0A3S1BB06_9CYAN|nr:hypothetical protein [Dulcicalothrix desertica]RUT08429.1 hypothetical protein DSM106972_015970 [Dulcicalothrix desertica PCC 7102]TWH40294.1 hypothetical protein CAL7102_09601 [Dulcicalothrix desertica PCC 7102]
MAIATRIDSSLSPTITQSTLADALKTAFINAGFSTPTDDYTSGTDRILVYRFDTETARNKGRNFLRVRISNTLVIACLIGTDWNTTTKAMTDSSAEFAPTALSASLPINFVSLNCASEGRFIFLSQGTAFIPLGILIPANRPTWWNLDTWSYGYFFSTITGLNFRGSSANPYGNADNTALTSAFLSNSNPGLSRDSLAGLVLLNNSNSGISAKTSDDIGTAAGNGAIRYDTLSFNNNTQRYLLAVNTANGLIFRIQ